MTAPHRLHPGLWLVLSCLVAICSPPSTTRADVLWYNGDSDGLDTIPNELNAGNNPVISIFDNFTVPADVTSWTLNTVFINTSKTVNYDVSSVSWSIRAGVSEGNGGTLVASGSTVSPAITPLGLNDANGYPEYKIEVSDLNVVLPPGTYWLNVTPVASGTGAAFAMSTSGTSAIGTPPGTDGHAFANGTFYNYLSTAAFGDYGHDHDFSFGVTGLASTAAPEISVQLESSAIELTDGVSSVDFGSISPGYGFTTAVFFTITNNGTADLTGLGITFDGTDASDFTVTADPASPLGPGQTTDFRVTFAPTAGAGLHSAALHIASNDADENPFDIALTGVLLTHHEAWRFQYFGTADNSGDGADANDFDGDGLRNDVEFATGTNPRESNPAPGVASLNGDTFEFLYDRAKAALDDGVTFSVETNTTPGNIATNANAGGSSGWTTVGVTEVKVDEDSFIEHWKASVAVGSGAARFLRLKITMP